MGRAMTALAMMVVLALTFRAGAAMSPGLDYFSDASGAIDALVRLDSEDFFASQPLMGSFSLLLRAPFVALNFHGSLDAVYYAGVLPCLLAVVVLGLALARRVQAGGQGQVVGAVVVVLAVVNPLTVRAVHWGHPEELLTAALCVGAVLVALSGRGLVAGLLLGLAVATKQWAVLAVFPVLLATGERPLRTLGVAVVVGSAFTLPMLLGDSGRFGTVAASAAGQDQSAALTTPWSVWWPFAQLVDLPGRGPRYVSPPWVPAISHLLIVALALPLSALLLRRRERRGDDALLLLTLLFLLRCALDNWNNDYYHVPFFLSLLAWETVRRPGVPRLSLVVALLLGISFWRAQMGVFEGSVDGAGLTFALYAAWAFPLAGLLAAILYRPATVAGLRARLWSVSAAP